MDQSQPVLLTLANRSEDLYHVYNVLITGAEDICNTCITPVQFPWDLKVMKTPSAPRFLLSVTCVYTVNYFVRSSVSKNKDIGWVNVRLCSEY